ncbi:methyl-accepting chemotaxis protein [Radicibacter daui]|uniref:methyl-accepting chemotaxis protein n=1 Tax=Radicibacter daui TaxID=3064829 RepID=UPI004046E832
MRISTKLLQLSAGYSGAIIVLGGLLWALGVEVNKSSIRADRSLSLLGATEELKRMADRISLAAMDSLVDSAAGTITPERQQRLAESRKSVADAIATLRSANVGEEAAITSVEGGFAKLDAAITQDLQHALEQFGKADDAFAKLDDAMDAVGDELTGAVEKLADGVQAAVSKASADGDIMATNQLLGSVGHIEEMRADVQAITLAAMDTIIDRDAGEIIEGRDKIVERAVEAVEQSLQDPFFATLPDGPGLVSRIRETLAAQRSNFFDTLQPLVVSQGKAKEVFDRLDDEIDAASDAIGAGLEDVSTAISTETREARLRAQSRGAALLRWAEITAALVLLAGAVFSLLLRRNIARSLADLSTSMRELAAGRLVEKIAGEGRRDEIGSMAETVIVFRDNLRENIKLREEREGQEKAAEAERHRLMQTVASELQAAIGGIASSVDSAVGELRQVSDKVNDAAGDTSRRSETASSDADDTRAAIQTVAAAAEEMTATIGGVREQTGEAARLADSTRDIARTTEGNVARLSEAARSIREVVSLINAVADQTNLLALNATIEAARAGEAGKGFAVVAQEVKSLATQTGRATDEIAGKIDEIGSITDQVVKDVSEIIAAIGSLAEVNGDVMSSVSQQTEATEEMSRSTRKVSDAIVAVADNLGSIRSVSAETRNAADAIVSAANTLARLSRDLAGAVDQQVKRLLA